MNLRDPAGILSFGPSDLRLHPFREERGAIGLDDGRSLEVAPNVTLTAPRGSGSP